MANTLRFIKRNDGLTDNLKPNGFAKIGCDGTQGMPGKPGMAYYFIDYDPSNSYYKELVLKRLEYNYILTTNNSNKLVGREYRVGDLIMSKEMNLYQITEPEENSNYKFGIKYIGRILPKKPFSSEALTKSFIGIELTDFHKKVERCVVPVNRSFDFDTSTNSNRFTFKMKSVSSANASIAVTLSNRGRVATGIVTVRQGEAFSTIINNIASTVNTIKSTYSEFSTINITHVINSDTILFEGSRNDWPEMSLTMSNGTIVSDSYHETQNPYLSDANYVASTQTYKTYDSSHSASFEEAYRGLYGISFRPSIRFDTTVSEEILKHYDFYLRIYIKNQKTIQSGAYGLESGISDNFTSSTIPADPVTSTNNNQFVFYKCLEMKLFNIDQDNVHYNDDTNMNETVYTDSSNYLYFISDMTADKLHPSGNNINVSYLPPETGNYGANIMLMNTLTNKIRYWAGISYDLNVPSPYFTILHNNNINNSMQDYLGFTSLFKNGTYADNHYITQYSKRYDSLYSPFPVNFRGGESTYFSGMTVPKFDISDSSIFASSGTGSINRTLANANGTYSSYVTNIMSTNRNVCVVDETMRKSNNSSDVALAFEAVEHREKIVMDYVTDNIYNFIFSPDNEYEIVCVSKNSASGIHVGDTKILKLDLGQITKY